MMMNNILAKSKLKSLLLVLFMDENYRICGLEVAVQGIGMPVLSILLLLISFCGDMSSIRFTLLVFIM